MSIKVPKEDALVFAGYSLQIEQRNILMNLFVCELIEKLNDNGINAILLKGQGIAQCYERPLWRSNGDVDLLLNKENYNRAKVLLSSFAKEVEEEDVKSLHYAVAIESWIVELHGTFRSGLGKRIDLLLTVFKSVFVRRIKFVYGIMEILK